MRHPPNKAAHSRGFTYLGVMFVVALLTLTAALASPVWSTVQKRENERELLFVGRQFQAAIERYARHAGGSTPTYPSRLDELLRDPRLPLVERHLRRLYPDPMTGSANWGLLRLADGSIVGVHSISPGVPLQRAAWAYGLSFPGATSYRDWRFVAPSAAGLLVAEPAGVALAKQPSDPSSNRIAPDAPGNPPVPPPSPEVANAPSPRPTQRDYRDRTPSACARIAAYDQEVCAEQTRLFGEQAGRDCQGSAVARTAACPFPDAGPLPPLFFRSK